MRLGHLYFRVLFIFLIGFVIIKAHSQDIVLGNSQTHLYFPKIKDKKVGLIANHTSKINNIHLVDYLLNNNINIVKIFSPEHGFRGDAGAGKLVNSSKDAKTGLPVVSLYGAHKKPTKSDLSNIDVLIFDIQDVGTRFYTYISTMHLCMEAAAEQNIAFIVLDRPNPNGHIIDGPVLQPGFESFVGMHPIPVLHGCTVGELAKMINGQKWLEGNKKVDLTVVPCQNYHHQKTYTVPVKPSPNLPNQHAILWYPSLCFLEGTAISVGRGTPFPFQVAGYPNKAFGNFTFTPTANAVTQSPKHNGQKCYGIDFRPLTPPDQISLSALIFFYEQFRLKDDFFKPIFNKLAGNNTLQQQIKDGISEPEIKQSWQRDLKQYLAMRKQYLLYP